MLTLSTCRDRETKINPSFAEHRLFCKNGSRSKIAVNFGPPLMILSLLVLALHFGDINAPLRPPKPAISLPTNRRFILSFSLVSFSEMISMNIGRGWEKVLMFKVAIHY